MSSNWQSSHSYWWLSPENISDEEAIRCRVHSNSHFFLDQMRLFFVQIIIERVHYIGIRFAIVCFFPFLKVIGVDYTMLNPKNYLWLWWLVFIGADLPEETRRFVYCSFTDILWWTHVSSTFMVRWQVHPDCSWTALNTPSKMSHKSFCVQLWANVVPM